MLFYSDNLDNTTLPQRYWMAINKKHFNHFKTVVVQPMSENILLNIFKQTKAKSFFAKNTVMQVIRIK